jgi:hypothetical protein
MTPFRLFLFCLVLLGAGFGLWTLAQGSGEGPPLIELPEAVDRPMMQGDVATLERIIIEQPRYGTSIRVDKRDDSWLITEPLVDQPEPLAIRYTLGVLYGDDWQEAPADWSGQSEADLGLDPAAAVVELLYSDGQRETLRIGAEEQSGRWRVALRDEQHLFRFPIASFRQLVRPTVQWRDHRLQPFGVNVDRLEWAPEEGEPLVLVHENNKWYLRQPLSAPLDDQAFPFLMQMLGWRADSMGNLRKQDVHMKEPLGVLTLEQGSRSVTLEIFRDGVLSDHRDYPIAYSRRAFHFLDLDLEEMRSSRVMDLDPDQVAAIKVEYGEHQATYLRRKDGWAESGDAPVVPEQSAFIASLLEHAMLLERGEDLPLPATPPAGRIFYSISRNPKLRGSQILQWWLDDQQRVVIAPYGATSASLSSINFELGVRSLFGL